MTLTSKQYQKLCRDVKTLLQKGKSTSKHDAAQGLIDMYWQVGKRIVEENLTGQANYGQSVLKDLSDEIRTDLRTLQYSVNFFETYRNTNRWVRNLTWSHYRILISVRDTKARAWYEKKASDDELTRSELAYIVRKNVYEQKSDKVLSRSTPKIKRPVQAGFVYKAVVERVIDADTLLLNIDLGFDVWRKQRIRLAKIDAPEMDTLDGKTAYKYVQETLAQVPYVVIKTHKVDIYGRFVCDVFYSFTLKEREEIFEQGTYLNQELLKANHAKILLMS